LDVAALGKGRQDWKALDATLHPRSPLSHYHRLGGWIQADLGDDCTTSGCHGPLPHYEHKEVRAFLNMHGTTLHCGVCHMIPHSVGSLQASWYDPQTGMTADAPAVLQALTLLDSVPSRETQLELLALLERAVAQSQSHPELLLLTQHVRSMTHTQSEGWPELLDLCRSALARHFRGEYGRKIALTGPDRQPILAHPNTNSAKARFRRLGTDATQAERDTLLGEVHPLRRPQPLDCSSCHKPDGLLPYAQLGYPPGRIEELTGQAIFKMVENIAAGQEFHLPRVLQPADQQ
jgi:hypothetical protein